MDITITINTDNAAFEDCESEVARILAQLARFAERNVSDMDKLPIMDINGNKVGRVEVSE